MIFLKKSYNKQYSGSINYFFLKKVIRNNILAHIIILSYIIFTLQISHTYKFHLLYL